VVNESASLDQEADFYPDQMIQKKDCPTCGELVFLANADTTAGETVPP
jgi:hypothetical protein